MGQKTKFLVKHGLAVNTQSGTTATLNYPTTDGGNQQYLRTDGLGNLQFDSPNTGGAGGNFLSLSDTPATYAGSPGRVLVVNDSGNGLTLSTSPLNNSQSRFEFTGNGTQTGFVTGTTQFTTVDHILVYVDGVIQSPSSNFSLDSTVITFTSAPANNADILVFGTVTASGFPQGLIDSDALTNPLGLRGRLNAGGHIVPKVDSAYDLGDSALKWRDLYLSGSSIHLGGQTIRADNQGVVLPAKSKIGNRRFGGSKVDSAEKGFDSDLKGSYGSTTAVPILTIDSAGFIDSIGTAAITSDLLGDTSPQLGGQLDLNGQTITGTLSIDSDTDARATIGRAGIGWGGQNDVALFGHVDHMNVNTFQLFCHPSETILGSPGVLRFNSNSLPNGGGGANVMFMDDSDGLTIKSGLPHYNASVNGRGLAFNANNSKKIHIKLDSAPSANRLIKLPDSDGTTVLRSDHGVLNTLWSSPGAAIGQQGAGLDIGAYGQGTGLSGAANKASVRARWEKDDFGNDKVALVLDGGSGYKIEMKSDVYMRQNQKLIFEGSTIDSFETSLLSINPTQDNTITLPDASGTVIVGSDSVTIPYLQIGSSADSSLTFSHSGPATISNNGIGHFFIQNGSSNVQAGQLTNIYFRAKSGENSIVCQGDQAVLLYYNNSSKFATTNTGVNVTGIITDDGATHDGDVTFTGVNYNVTWDKSTNEMRHSDGAYGRWGTNNTKYGSINHNGNDFYIVNRGTAGGNMEIRNSTPDKDIIIKADDGAGGVNGANYIIADGSTGKVKLHYYGSVKMNTMDSGVDVTGRLKASAGIEFNDGTTQTTAASGSGGGVTTGKAIAMAMIFG